MSSHLEVTFKNLWYKERMENSPEPDLKLKDEVRFHPTRRWRFDFAHEATLVAIEVEGGTWVGGRHTRPAGFHKNCEKYNAANLLGWTVFRLTPQMIKGEFIQPIQEFILDRLNQQKTTSKRRKNNGNPRKH